MRYSQVRTRLLVLIVAGISFSACATAGLTITALDPALERRADVVQAAQTLHDTLVGAKAYPHIQPRCLYYDLMAADPRNDYPFAVRFNQAKCGGNSWSNLLERFSVIDGRVLWSDTADGGTLKPLSEFLKSRNPR